MELHEYTNIILAQLHRASSSLPPLTSRWDIGYTPVHLLSCRLDPHCVVLKKKLFLMMLVIPPIPIF